MKFSVNIKLYDTRAIRMVISTKNPARVGELLVSVD